MAEVSTHPTKTSSPTRVMPGSLYEKKVVVQPQKLSPFSYNGPISCLNTYKETEDVCSQLVKLDGLQTVGFDMEWKVSFKKNQGHNRTALIQFCYEKDTDVYDCILVQVLYSGITPSLQKILTSDKIQKVGVNIVNDASKIQRDYGVQMGGVVELMSEARSRILDEGSTSGFNGKVNLAALVEKLLGKEIDKNDKVRKGNWERRELNQDQIQYAASDAYASLLLYKKLMTCKLATPQEVILKAPADSTLTQINTDNNSSQQNIVTDAKAVQAPSNQETATKVEDQNTGNDDQISEGKENRGEGQGQRWGRRKSRGKGYGTGSQGGGNFKRLKTAYDSLNAWEKTQDYFVRCTPSKEDVHKQFFAEQKSFEEISKLKGIKIETVRGYFGEVIISGYCYQWDQLAVPQETVDIMSERLKELWPELFNLYEEIQNAIEQDMILQPDSNFKNMQELRMKIQQLTGTDKCVDLVSVVKSKKDLKLKDIRGDTNMDYNDMKFYLLHVGRILCWLSRQS